MPFRQPLDQLAWQLHETQSCSVIRTLSNNDQISGLVVISSHIGLNIAADHGPSRRQPPAIKHFSSVQIKLSSLSAEVVQLSTHDRWDSSSQLRDLTESRIHPLGYDQLGAKIAMRSSWRDFCFPVGIFSMFIDPFERCLGH